MFFEFNRKFDALSDFGRVKFDIFLRKWPSIFLTVEQIFRRIELENSSWITDNTSNH